MARVESSAALYHLHTLWHTGTVGGLTDGQLLERFVAADAKTAEHAFAALVARHGPMVLGVCSRILKDPHDAADAFQATFLVLVRKAITLRVEDSLGRWLYGVSRRVAMQARKVAARRSAREVSSTESLEAPSYNPENAELLAALDEEIVRLPAKYQAAVVLCDLEGLSHEAAAQPARLPGRYDRKPSNARARTSPKQADPCGFNSWAMVSGPAFRGHLASGSVPPKLANATIHAANRAAVKGGAAVVSPSIHALAVGYAEAMVVTRIKLALFALPLLVLGTMAATPGNTNTSRETLGHFTQANPIGVKPQGEAPAITLEGRTIYDPNTLSKIRLRFNAMIEKVHVSRGQTVKKSQPLLDLFSTDLAAAKNDFLTAYVQWQHDLTLRMVREELAKTKDFSKQVLTDIRNDENKSRLAVTTARQNLVVFEVPERQIDELVKNLKRANPRDKDDVHSFKDKAKMTRLSPVDGIVVLRDVVPGNLCHNKDVLMVVAPVDHFLVWVRLPKKDLAQVKEGQACEVLFPYLDRRITTKVDRIIEGEAPDRPATVLMRMTIPNPDGRLKADMLVRVRLRPVSGDGKRRGES